MDNYYVIIQRVLCHFHIIVEHQIIRHMVKIQPFKGYTYSSQDYDTLLKFNHQSLSKIRESARTYISRTSTIDQIQSGVLTQEQKPAFYIYSQKFMDKISFGLMAEASVEDFLAGKIKVHQKTLCRQGLGAETYCSDHVGPIIFSYRSNQACKLRNLLIDISMSQKIYSQWNTADGRSHKLWKIQQDLGIAEYFQKINNLYVLDGHHRLKAAVQNSNINSENPKSKWFQSLIYPPEEVSIHPFHRIITEQTQSKFNILNFLESNKIEYTLIPDANKSDLQKYEIIFKNPEGFFGINFHDSERIRNCIENLSVQKLKTNILDPIYQQQVGKYLDFMPGIYSWEDLVEKNKNIFLVRSVKIDEIFTIADENEIMPPKSTWFEPKPCNKMVIRLPY